MPLYRIKMVPSEGQPQEFEDTNPATGETISRPLLRDIRCEAENEDEARKLAENQAFDIATAEVAQGGDVDPDSAESADAVLAKQYVIESIEEVE